MVRTITTIDSKYRGPVTLRAFGETDRLRMYPIDADDDPSWSSSFYAGGDKLSITRYTPDDERFDDVALVTEDGSHAFSFIVEDASDLIETLDEHDVDYEVR